MADRLILLAHGAGASSASDWMQAFGRRLSALGRVETFDYPYMRAGRKRPDPQPELVRSHHEALARARRETDETLVLAGKSMGSRIGCHVALDAEVDALVCFGYPLRAAGSGKLRDAVLLELRTPILFVSGTRDELCPLDALERVRSKMQCDHELFVIEGGDHSLRVRKTDLGRQARTQEDVDQAIIGAVRRFLEHRRVL